MIKNDLKTHKFIKVLTVFAWITGVISLALVIICDKPAYEMTDLDTILAILSAFFLTVDAFLIPISTAILIHSTVYLRRLKVAGEQTNRYSKDSIWAARYSLICLGISIIGDLIYLIYWIRIESDAIALFILLLIGQTLLFGGLAIYFNLQKNQDKYRDNVDPIDNNRRARVPITVAIIVLTFALLLSFAAITIASSMTNYVHKTREEARETEITENINR